MRGHRPGGLSRKLRGNSHAREPRECVANSRDIAGFTYGHRVRGTQNDIRSVEKHILGREESIITPHQHPLPEPQGGGETQDVRGYSHDGIVGAFGDSSDWGMFRGAS